MDGAVDRLLLGNIVLSSPAELKRLEDIIHPLVAQEREIFFTNAEKANAFAVVFDIPLLFEKHMESDVDVVIVVTASPETQRNRVLSRPGVSVERFEAIIAKQLPDELKREKADFVINTDFQGFAAGRAQLTKIIETLIERDQHRYALWKRNFGNNLSSVANGKIIFLWLWILRQMSLNHSCSRAHQRSN